ncbi:MAG: PAS domain-containing sensor histidine kinase [Proteobacteria bacterium]|nr:PAS domain-containing sensor histidine kinase [Pseudomonadota bacterium]
MLDNELLRRIIDLSDDAFVAIDAGQKILLFNGGAERLFGYTNDEAVGRTLDLLIPSAAILRHRAFVEDFAGSDVVSRRMGERRAVHGQRKNGEIFPAEISITAIRNGKTTYYAAILRDATPQHAREEELRVAKNLAVTSNSAKSEFLSHMSHELRTPLNAIIGFSQVMQAELFGPLGNPRYEGYVADIHASAQHLLDLVSDVLDMSRIEAGKAELHSAAIDIGETIAQSLRLVASQAQQDGIALETDVPAATPRVVGDPRAVKQIFVNLLSNAVKFTRRGGHVRVRARRTPEGGLAVSVADTGVGIAAKDIARVRRPFEQVQNGYNAAKGTGLGLALVDRLIEMHDGRLELASAEGTGTTATIHFPPERTAQPVRPKAPAGHELSTKIIG